MVLVLALQVHFRVSRCIFVYEDLSCISQDYSGFNCRMVAVNELSMEIIFSLAVVSKNYVSKYAFSAA